VVCYGNSNSISSGTAVVDASFGGRQWQVLSEGGGCGGIGGDIRGGVVDGDGGVGGGSAQTSIRGRGRVRGRGVWPRVVAQHYPVRC
jgi:hypothetical protein